jgi:hypothetical protein
MKVNAAAAGAANLLVMRAEEYRRWLNDELGHHIPVDAAIHAFDDIMGLPLRLAKGTASPLDKLERNGP